MRWINGGHVMWGVRLFLIGGGIWIGVFSFINLMRLLPPLLRGQISALLLALLLLGALKEWLQERNKYKVAITQYKESRWHWLIHERNGDPSAWRVIFLVLFTLAIGYAIAGHLSENLDFAALFD